MRPVANAYATRHFEEAAHAVRLQAGERVLELGAGMGRFSTQFAEKPCPVTCVELSADLAGVCRDALRPYPRAEVRVADALRPADDLAGGFDVVAGFFFLHHLADLGSCFAGARRCLKPGGRFVFVEPNPFNPLYYLQITFTPSMSWRSERGMFSMREKVVRRIAAAAGFADVRVARYGAVPRGVYNALAKVGSERLPERLVPPGMRPFVVFTGVAP